MKFSNILFLFLVSCFFCSCEDFFEQTVEIDVPEHSPVLAVTANFTDRDTNLRVFVSHTIGILVNEDSEYISDATVELFKNGELLHELVYENNAYWAKSIAPLGNEPANYTLKVSAPGYESIEATQSMPVVAEMVSVNYEEDGTLDEFGDRANELTIEFNDPAGIDNYYFNKINIFYDDGQGNIINDFRFLDSIDPITEESNEGATLTDASFDGDNYKLKLYSYENISNITGVGIYVQLLSASREKYLRSKSLTAYQNSVDNPFAEPAVVFSNITGGEGIFTLSATSELKLEF